MITTFPRAVARNDWPSLQVRDIGAPPQRSLSVSVVVPAHECQAELDLTCAALAAQSHPADLIEVVIVDDRSDPPLQLPDIRPTNTTIIRADGAGHGSGRARDIGARASDGDALLFLDADIIAARTHVEAHARWHEVTDDAVVLGTREFVDTSGLTPVAVNLEVYADQLLGLVEGREREPHAWIDRVWASTADLTADREDLWRPVVGASVSTSRRLYEFTGGFAHFPRRGIVDTEFGYRCFTAGGVIIPDRSAHSLHQGQRTHATQGDLIARQRRPLVANRIASPRYRAAVPGRQWAVPYVHVVVPAQGLGFFGVELTVEDLLANEFDDLIISVVAGEDEPDRDLFVDCWGADGRVRLVDEAPTSGFPSPFTMMVPPGARFQGSGMGELIKQARTWQHGLISVSVTGLPAPVELWATRALTRTGRHSHDDGLREIARDLFGERWLAGESVGIGTGSGVADQYFQPKKRAQSTLR